MKCWFFVFQAKERNLPTLMALILRKLWGLVSRRRCSTADDNSVIVTRSKPESIDWPCSSSLGVFDYLPTDVVMQIVKMVGPKEAARMSLVSKAWRLVVSDNRLWIYFLQNQKEPWDSIFFAETMLRFGYPIQLVTSFLWIEYYFSLLKLKKVILQRIVNSCSGIVILFDWIGFFFFFWIYWDEFCCRTFPTQMSEVSYMHIFGQRAQVPGSIIIDGEWVGGCFLSDIINWRSDSMIS